MKTNKKTINKILQTNGRFFSAMYIKKDGEIRSINARLGVKKGTTGKGLAFNAFERGYLPVYDVQKRAFRMLNLNTLLEICVDGKRNILW